MTLLPLWQLFELGFAIAIGLVIDTFCARTLVVPAATALLRERAWWPGKVNRSFAGR